MNNLNILREAFMPEKPVRPKVEAEGHAVGDIVRVRDLQDPKYALVQTDQDVADTLESIGYDNTEEGFDHLLIEHGDGEYVEVWGINGTPYLANDATLLYKDGEVLKAE